jgi:hypothetical protein
MRSTCCAVLLLFLVTGCGSAPSLGPERPAVNVQQVTPIYFGSGATAPVHLDVQIQNLHREPIRIRTVRVEAGAGMGMFSIYPVQRELSQEIAPGAVVTIPLVATAYTRLSRHEPNEPFSVRATIDLLVAGKRHRQMYLFRDIGM